MNRPFFQTNKIADIVFQFASDEKFAWWKTVSSHQTRLDNSFSFLYVVLGYIYTVAESFL
jgi:hypothetical protein